ncbi:MAG: efflux RND transporter periplasmic adaptor subunit [Rhodobacteraceae bacterium]|nr:efflux RND transporter periplasmic adaptor subunit [Paracoccaceae bacterium]
MRIFSLLTAALVALALYFLVIQRDQLFAALRGSPPDSTQQEPAETPGAGVTETAAAPQQDDAEDSVPRLSVLAVKSVAQNVVSGALLRGQTEAARSVEVRSETSGLVVSEPLRKGIMVDRGQLLCELDPGTRLAALEEARARLREADISARATSQLASEGFASEIRRTSALAALESAKAVVTRAEKEIERLRMTAPFSGLLESDTAETGSLLQQGGLCAQIIQLHPIRIVGYITEADVDDVVPGSPAGATLSSGREVEGLVTFISKSADSATRTFRLEVTAQNEDYSIRDGSSAEIFVTTTTRQAHFVPQSALTLNDSGELGVRLAIDGLAKFFPVEIIRDSTEGMWIAGLDPEATVIVVGQEFVVDGSAVEVTYMEDPE